MKKKLIILATTLGLSFNAFAISQKAALNEDAVNIANSIQQNLGYEFKDEDKLEIYNKIFKSYVEEEGRWDAKPVAGNEFLSGSKVDKKGNVTFIEYAFSYNQRTVFINLTLFKKEKQIHATTKEIVPAPTETVFNIYNETKEDKKWKSIYEADNYSMFHEDGYLSFKNFHVYKGNATIIHTSSKIINLD